MELIKKAIEYLNSLITMNKIEKRVNKCPLYNFMNFKYYMLL